MAYDSLTIKQIVSDISERKYYLPAIQRKFVWGEDKICNLFDSIMRDYPIGTFLFWDLPVDKANQYTFYEFLKNYHQRDSKNELVRYDFTREIRGVLDGQQRISSIYIALQGVFTTRRKHAHKNNNNAYSERKFYINLLGGDGNYEFKFLTDKDANQRTEDSYYYLVRNILTQPKDVDAHDILDALDAEYPDSVEILIKQRKSARRKLSLLIKKLNEEELINYFKIVDKDLDDILDIFVRVNSGGTILSKSDLLFSTLVAHWDNGRELVEKLINDMNGESGRFGFNSDFLMRTCLFLVDAPMSFKVSTFDSKNINKIKSNWDDIRVALISAVNLLKEFGFDRSRLSSNYAITPIAYYIYKGGVVDATTKLELRKLVIHSLLKQVYSGQADSALSALRDGLRVKSESEQEPKTTFELKESRFCFADFKSIKMPSGKKLTIDNADIEDFLELKKGSFAFLVLSTLYPDLKLDQVNFHQDHMHPYSKFSNAILKEKGFDEIKIKHWQDLRDQLPNLQLLEGTENQEKLATDFKVWVEERQTTPVEYYKSRNYLSDGLSLEFEDFEGFFENRKQLIRNKLYGLFDVSASKDPEEA